MLIAANKLSAYLDATTKALGPLPSSSYKIDICHQTNQLWRIATADEVRFLADKQQLVGIGSVSRLKYTKLLVEAEEAQATLKQAGFAHGSKTREKFKGTEASQTAIPEAIVTKRCGRIGNFRVWKHVRSWGFSPQARSKYT